MTGKQKKMLSRIAASAVLTIALALLPDKGVLPLGGFAGGLLYYLAVYILIGYDILRKSFRNICNGRVFDENFLMAVATLGAFSLAVWSGSGDYLEAIAVMLFYQTGELFQSIAVSRSRQSISDLMDIRPDYANVEDEFGNIEQADPDDVEIGQTIVVNPGEKVPIDGVVASGESSLDTAALTGESLPLEVGPGDGITSGSINLSGVLRITTTKEFGESTVSKILELVEDSASHKSKSETFISKFARVYTPVVCISALVLAIVPPLMAILSGSGDPMWGEWIYRALTFLVISCPCALVVSIPLSFFAGIGGASHEGILVKGADILESLSKVRTVVMDKTGTLTKGVFSVTKVCPFSEDTDILEVAALAECRSSHPISRSLLSAYGRKPDMSRVSDVRETGGHGITALVDFKDVAVGNARLMRSLGIEPIEHESETGTIVHVAVNGMYKGHIILGDVVKETSREALYQIREAGITSTVMLTGDKKAVAENVASSLGIQKVYSELLPADKAEILGRIISESPKGKVAFVGDGINDAPTLSRADVGIAMGGVGSDAAIEASDVVLMDDDPIKIAKAVRISRKTMSIVWQNITMAIGIKGICLILGALGIASMWLAIFADVGVMVLAVLNAIRAMYTRHL